MPATQTTYATTSQTMKAKMTPGTDACVIDQNSAYQSGTTAINPPIAASVNISRAGRGVRHKAITPARQNTRCHMTRTRAVLSQIAAITSALTPSHSATGQENKFSAVMVMTVMPPGPIATLGQGT